ncbi:MAG: FAD-dependent monooxygenase [Candidatus Solibacter sp.]
MIVLPQSTDLFVIGGGPAGLAAAIAARRCGLNVMLADSAVPPIDKACGEGIMPDGIAAAAALGLDLGPAGGHAFDGIRFCDRRAIAEAEFPSGHGLGLRRTALHELMLEHAHACGVRLLWGTRVVGIQPDGVTLDDRHVRAKWIAGADGGHSTVRRWAGLDACHRDSRRFGFRRHYRLAPWSRFMEIHWAKGCQLYITPVADSEICVVSISRDQRLRLDNALALFPEVARRLAQASLAQSERGGVTATRRLKAVCRGNVALLGDASGSVDAITGEGLCLLFQQALALAGALEAGDLSLYREAHRRIGRRPEWMAEWMLLLDRSEHLRSRAVRAFVQRPALFAGMLAMHVGEFSPADVFTNSLSLGWHMLTL